MSEEFVIEITQYTLYTVGLLVAPAILVIVVVGILVNVLQTVTQIRDQSLVFVPKVIAFGIVLILCIPWYFSILEKYVNVIFSLISEGAS